MAVWHRRAGKDLFGINLCVTSMIERRGLYWHLLPTYNQGRKIVWDGFTKEGRSFLDYFPPELIANKNSTEMRITLKTGSIYQVVGTDDPDRLVGTNPVGCIFSEYSLQDPKAWNIIRPILAENEGWALFIYTARGRNHGYTMREMAKRNPKWFHSELVAGDSGTKRPDGTPVLSDEVIQDERDAGMPEELIQQEFYCSFEAPVVGAYYGKQMMAADKAGRITTVPWEPTVPVHTMWDLGIDDEMVIWFFQAVGLERRFFDYYSNSGEGLAHYARILKEDERGEYIYGTHFAPHDIEVRELGTGKSRKEIAKSMGIKFKTVKRHEVADGIEATRNFLAAAWFDDKKCADGVEALRQYRKGWDDTKKTFSSTPLHDWSSHAADALRIGVWGFKKSNRGKKPPQLSTIDQNYDPLNN